MEKILLDEGTQYTREEASKLYNELRFSLLREGKAIYLTVFGGSMYPFIKSGDKIKIEPMPIGKEKIIIGDVVVVDRKAEGGFRFLIHRVVKIIGNGGNRVYFTKGDAHKDVSLEGPLAIDSIIGRVTQIKRKGLDIDFKIPLWRYLNSFIGRLSFRHPKVILSLSNYINIILERKLFLIKVKNRLKKANPILYNTEELILLCARRGLDEELKDKAVDLIREGIDWETFCNYAMRGGFTVLIYGSLKEISGHTYIPEDAIDKLRCASIFIISKSVSQERKLAEILKLFTVECIPVIPLKGIILAKRLFGDIASRGLSGDFDLLIKENDKEKAIVLLKKTGYTFDSDEEAIERQWQYTFQKPGTSTILIDLHWDITMGCRSQKRIDGFWNGTRRVEIDGISYYEFKEEELLLHLCAHLVNSDCCRNLRYLSDINQLLYNNHLMMNWESIIKKANEWSLSSSLYVALSTCRKLFNASIPDEILDKIKPSLGKRVFIGIFVNKKFILHDCKRKNLMNLYLAYVFFELVEAETFFEYYNIIFRRVLFPPRDVLLSNKSYSLKPVFVGYIFRFFRGICNLFSNIKYEK